MPIDEQPFTVKTNIDEQPLLPSPSSVKASKPKSTWESLTESYPNDPQPPNYKTTDYSKLIPAGLTFAGGMFGGPIGAATGAGLGEYAMNPESPGSALATSLMTLLMPSGEISPLRQNAYKFALNKVFPDVQSQAVKEGLAQYPELNPTVAQATKSEVAQGLERFLAGGTKRKIEQQQQAQVPEMLQNLRQQQFGERAVSSNAPNKFAAMSAPLKLKEDQAWDYARGLMHTERFQVKVSGEPTGILGSNGQPLTNPTYESKDVTGPVNVQSALGFAKKIKDQLDPLWEQLPESEKSNLWRLRNTVNTIVTKGVKPDEGGNYFDFDTIKQLRTDLNRGVAQASRTSVGGNLDRQYGGLAKISKMLEDDIADSVNTWPGDKNGEVSAALRSADLASTKRFGANAFDKLVYKNTNQATGQFDPIGFFNNMDDPSQKFRGMITAESRKNIKPLMDALQAVKPDPSNMGRYGLAISGGRFLLPAAGGLIGGREGAVVGGLADIGLEVSAHSFAKSVLFNPRIARLAAKLPSLPTDSFEASTITKTLLNAMKGEAVYLTTPDGGRIQAHIDENGKPKPDFQFQR